MLQHPVIEELLLKQRIEEYHREAEQCRLRRAACGLDSSDSKRACKLILFIADVLIKAGTGLRKRAEIWQLSRLPVGGK